MEPVRPKVRWARLVAVGVLAAVGLPLGIQYFGASAEYARDAASLPALEARARAIGLPLDLEDLDTKHPTGQDAAPVYAEAIALFKRLPPETEQDLFPLGKTAIQDRERALGRCTELLPVLRRLSTYPHCSFQRNRSSAFDTNTDIGSFKGLAKLACAQAEWEAHAGKRGSALEWLRVAAVVCRHAGSEPFLGWFIQRALEAILSGSMQRTLDPETMTLAQVDQAQAVLGELGVDDLNGMRGELVQRYNIYEALDEFDDLLIPAGWWDRIVRLFSSPEDFAYDSRPFRPFLHSQETVERAYRARLLSRWVPFFERLGAEPDVSQIAVELATLDKAIKSGSHRIDAAERQLAEVFAVSDALLGAVARRRLAHQAFDVVRYRVRSGKLPARLDEVGPPLVDPFDGKPLRYRVAGKGFVLYSIDRDRVDDGGTPRNSSRRTGDLLFELPKPGP